MLLWPPTCPLNKHVPIDVQIAVSSSGGRNFSDEPKVLLLYSIYLVVLITMGTLWLSFQYSLITPKMKTSSIEEFKKKKFRFSDLQTWPVFILKCYHSSKLNLQKCSRCYPCVSFSIFELFNKRYTGCHCFTSISTFSHSSLRVCSGIKSLIFFR